MYIVDGIAYAGEREKPLAVVAVKPLDDYKLWTRFSTGASRIFDFAPLLDTGAFKALKDKAVFCGVYVDGGVPCWNNGQIDIAPEYLYENGRTK
jgi:hypothetical protein